MAQAIATIKVKVHLPDRDEGGDKEKKDAFMEEALSYIDELFIEDDPVKFVGANIDMSTYQSLL